MALADRRSAFAFAASAFMLPLMPTAHATSQMLIDDFTGPDGVSRIGTRWEGFTDRVMGGRSNGRAAPAVIAGRQCLRLTGRVDTRGGGFVQMALDLARDGACDATRFAGIVFDVYGNGETYNAHLRTTDVRWYDQSYRASFVAPAAWTTVRLPWAEFQPANIDRQLRRDGLMRIGLLGWMRDFDVDLAIGRLAFY